MALHLNLLTSKTHFKLKYPYITMHCSDTNLIFQKASGRDGAFGRQKCGGEEMRRRTDQR